MSATAQIDSAAAARVGAQLARTCFAERVEAQRRGGFATYQPWPLEDTAGAGAGVLPEVSAHAVAGKGGLGDALWRLCNAGEVRREAFDAQLWADLCTLELAAEPAALGRFELTAHRSLIAARDRPRPGARGHVHIGEDSLRFAEAILGVAPRGVALDVGSGSGISTCALGRTCEQVHAIDVVEECLDATSLSMGLNGMGSKSVVALAQLDAFEGPVFDCVIGNLPGVPVPPGLEYPPDGAGGPDGLALMRLFLERCQSTFTNGSGIVVMRFQSLGDARGPLLLAELQEIAKRARWDISVMTESRIPAEVRAGLTAFHALPVNPGSEPLEMLAVADAHLAGSGYHEYYASTLFARPGAGSVIYNNLSEPSLVQRPLRLAGAAHGAAPGGSPARTLDAARTIIPAYYGRAHDLPDSFWELGSLAYIYEPALRLEQLLECFAQPATLPQALARVFAEEIAADPIRTRFLYVTLELLLACLLDARVLVDA